MISIGLFEDSLWQWPPAGMSLDFVLNLTEFNKINLI
jgi:hypothetical protein